jgi:DMSO/TMAO reductase YedYZ molybdopterin-dependent catalytic subunit
VGSLRLGRRRFLLGGLGLTGAFALGACDRLPSSRGGQAALQAGEDATHFVQRLLLTPQSMAPEFSPADISKTFKPNGSTDPDDPVYHKLVEGKFSTYRLKIGGLVEKPFDLSLDELRALPSRTQITRHDCVEGWSCIGKWKGAPLSALLLRAVIKPQARFIIFRCADSMDEASLDSDREASRYYESIDLIDAFHPQTILAYDMNEGPLEVAHGAPLRLRVERQLGYKMAKYVMAIEVVDSFASIHGGRGGYWEDQGYDWYAGI